MSDLSHGHDAAHAEHGHDEHGGLGKYMAVAGALVVLTALSYWTFTPLWPFGENIAIKRLWMMAVSCSKAMLVILFFMHLLWEANWKWVLTIPASLMSVFLCLALVPDIGMRQNNGFGGYSRERLLYAADVVDETPSDPGDADGENPDSQQQAMPDQQAAPDQQAMPDQQAVPDQ